MRKKAAMTCTAAFAQIFYSSSSARWSIVTVCSRVALSFGRVPSVMPSRLAQSHASFAQSDGLFGSVGGSGGSSGQGGQGGTDTDEFPNSFAGGGGGGFLSAGASGTASPNDLPAIVGKGGGALSGTAAGGVSGFYAGDGGYGGGGGGAFDAGGGGGGFSGGVGCANNNPGGGGGSFVAAGAQNTMLVSGIEAGNGSVMITPVPSDPSSRTGAATQAASDLTAPNADGMMFMSGSNFDQMRFLQADGSSNSLISGGTNNLISDGNSAVIGGSGNVASGENSAAIGGSGNIAPPEFDPAGHNLMADFQVGMGVSLPSDPNSSQFYAAQEPSGFHMSDHMPGLPADVHALPIATT